MSVWPGVGERTWLWVRAVGMGSSAVFLWTNDPDPWYRRAESARTAASSCEHRFGPSRRQRKVRMLLLSQGSLTKVVTVPERDTRAARNVLGKWNVSERCYGFY